MAQMVVDQFVSAWLKHCRRFSFFERKHGKDAPATYPSLRRNFYLAASQSSKMEYLVHSLIGTMSHYKWPAHLRDGVARKQFVESWLEENKGLLAEAVLLGEKPCPPKPNSLWA